MQTWCLFMTGRQESYVHFQCYLMMGYYLYTTAGFLADTLHLWEDTICAWKKTVTYWSGNFPYLMSKSMLSCPGCQCCFFHLVALASQNSCRNAFCGAGPPCLYNKSVCKDSCWSSHLYFEELQVDQIRRLSISVHYSQPFPLSAHDY